MKNELLRLEHICFQYEDKFPALKDVSITFQKGERIVVLGNNGAGKSTFFLCCNGILRPQSGAIFLHGQKISGSKEDIRKLRQTVGLVFQEPDTQIIAGTVGNEVSFGPMNLGLDRKEVELRITKSLARMNLEGYESRAPHYLSGGEKKRVSIADILAMEPDMILLDEPTASLDPENVALLERTLEELNEAGITLVVSTHDVDFAYGFARRAVVLSQGEIIRDSDIEEVFRDDEVLEKAGLKKPLLCKVAEVLETHFPEAGDIKRPRRMEAFSDYAKRLLGQDPKQACSPQEKRTAEEGF